VKLTQPASDGDELEDAVAVGFDDGRAVEVGGAVSVAVGTAADGVRGAVAGGVDGEEAGNGEGRGVDEVHATSANAMNRTDVRANRGHRSDMLVSLLRAISGVESRTS